MQKVQADVEAAVLARAKSRLIAARVQVPTFQAAREMATAAGQATRERLLTGSTMVKRGARDEIVVEIEEPWLRRRGLRWGSSGSLLRAPGRVPTGPGLRMGGCRQPPWESGGFCFSPRAAHRRPD